MLAKGLVTEVRADTGIDVLTNVIFDVDVAMLGGVEIIIAATVVIALEFSVIISYVLDVVAGVIICCESNIGVDVFTDMNMFFLTAPSEEAMPSCCSKFDCRPMAALDRPSVLQAWMPSYQV